MFLHFFFFSVQWKKKGGERRKFVLLVNRIVVWFPFHSTKWAFFSMEMCLHSNWFTHFLLMAMKNIRVYFVHVLAAQIVGVVVCNLRAHFGWAEVHFWFDRFIICFQFPRLNIVISKHSAPFSSFSLPPSLSLSPSLLLPSWAGAIVDMTKKGFWLSLRL